MPPRRTVPLAVWFLLFAVIVAANAFVFRGALGHWVAGVASPAAVALVSRVRGASVDARVAALEAEVSRLRSRAALDEAVIRERDLYRAAAGIRERLRREPVHAGIVAYPRAGGVTELVVNRGTRDWVAAGDIVITGEGVLVGVVREAWEDHAVVVSPEDPSVHIAARLSGTAVTGLVRSDGEHGLLLDLVDKDEPVTEGLVVETAGSDRYPAGIIIGTVRAVDATQATLFAVVRLERPAPVGRAADVLVIRP